MANPQTWAEPPNEIPPHFHKSNSRPLQFPTVKSRQQRPQTLPHSSTDIHTEQARANVSSTTQAAGDKMVPWVPSFPKNCYPTQLPSELPGQSLHSPEQSRAFGHSKHTGSFSARPRTRMEKQQRLAEPPGNPHHPGASATEGSTNTAADTPGNRGRLLQTAPSTQLYPKTKTR